MDIFLPKCRRYGCNKITRRLNVNSDIPSRYCTLKCAAIDALSMTALERWCYKHQRWEDEIEQHDGGGY